MNLRTRRSFRRSLSLLHRRNTSATIGCVSVQCLNRVESVDLALQGSTTLSPLSSGRRLRFSQRCTTRRGHAICHYRAFLRRRRFFGAIPPRSFRALAAARMAICSAARCRAVSGFDCPVPALRRTVLFRFAAITFGLLSPRTNSDSTALFTAVLTFGESPISYFRPALCFVRFFPCPRLAACESPAPLLFALIACVRFPFLARHERPLPTMSPEDSIGYPAFRGSRALVRAVPSARDRPSDHGCDARA